YQIDREQQILIVHSQGPNPGKARSLRRADPIVKEKPDALDLEIADDKTVRTVFARRHVVAGVVFAVPGRRERVAADCELVDVRFAKKNAHQFSFRVVEAETDRSFEWRRAEADADISRRSAGRWRRRWRWSWRRRFLR